MMLVAEKIETLAVNQERVYHAGIQKGFLKGKAEGYQEGHAEGYRQGTTEGFEAGQETGFQNGFESGYADGHSLGISEGEQKSYDEFWDRYQAEGKRGDYLYAFAGSGWKDGAYNPKYPIKIDGSCIRMFSYSGVTDTLVDIDASGIERNATYMFEYSKLETIRKLIWNENVALANQFTGCSELKNITFGGKIGRNVDLHWSKLLTRDSIVNVIGVLSDSASGYTATFSINAVNSAFETSDGASDGSTSEAWLSLVATKSNWTISLV